MIEVTWQVSSNGKRHALSRVSDLRAALKIAPDNKSTNENDVLVASNIVITSFL